MKLELPGWGKTQVACSKQGKSMNAVLWKLPVPSTGLHREPRFYPLRAHDCCLWWIAEKAEGGGRNEALIFNEVFLYKVSIYRAYPEPIRYLTYDKIVDMGRTPLLTEVLSLPRAKEAGATLKHFAISFDTGPLFEFIAETFRFESPFDTGALQSEISRRLASTINPVTGV